MSIDMNYLLAGMLTGMFVFVLYTYFEIDLSALKMRV